MIVIDWLMTQGGWTFMGLVLVIVLICLIDEAPPWSDGSEWQRFRAWIRTVMAWARGGK